ncbi:YtpI family protein [Domibacillus sp. A3M-37]|uniref:YtpI family protein n=1 Tax=Domibacillus TaxID=1433999 RepID=UPI000617C5F3|nr:MULTISPECIES: YtpI family protein [Domibacillus]MCP3762483.1 YtpI family protein [Domibacillus sp. A3M-37]
MPNFFLVVIIVLSFIFYLFYKVQYVRSSRPMERKWLSAKSSMVLGLFVGMFGVNTLLIQQTTTAYIVAAVFILYGFASMIAGFKMYKHYLPFARQEAEELDR